MPTTCRDTKVSAIVETLVYSTVSYIVSAFECVSGSTLYTQEIVTRTLSLIQQRMLYEVIG